MREKQGSEARKAMPTKRRGKKEKGFAKPGRKDSETGARHHRNSENNRISHGLRESGETPRKTKEGDGKTAGQGTTEENE